MKDPPNNAKGAAFLAWLGRALEHPKLGLRLALIAAVFASPSLFIGFRLDDYVGRYAYSDLPGAHEVYRILSSAFGVANGNPEDTHWLIEEGYAPWWTYPKLLIGMFRPVSLLSHYYEFRYFPDAAFLMHAQSLLWFAALVVAGTRFYRGVLGPMVGGLAAFLFAFDHTHGFAIGFIANRNALITVTFGLLALDQYHRAREEGSRGKLALAVVAYATALLAGEMSLAAMGYLVAYALFADKGTRLSRALSLLPFFVVTSAWRAAYQALGYGAKYCGLYVDPGTEPAHFLGLLFQRAPVLLLGELMAPPAEVSMLSPALAKIILAGALLFVAALGLALYPLLARSRTARFWAAGLAFSLIPASTTHPSNRLLFYASIGAMGLLAELWELYAVTWVNTALRGLPVFSKAFGSLLLVGHLLVSPLALPFTVCSVAVTAPINRAFDDLKDDVGDRDVVFLTAPDYYSVKLMPMERRVRHQPIPRRWRVVSYGPQEITVERLDDRTLRVDYAGGILGTPLFELYRDRRLPMTVGETIELRGLDIRVRSLTPDGRAESALFSFDTSLDSPSFRYFVWRNNHFEPWKPPPVGGKTVLPGAVLKLGL